MSTATAATKQPQKEKLVKKLYGIIGAGGFGREVMPIAENQMSLRHDSEHDSEIVFVLEDKLSDTGNLTGAFHKGYH